MRSYVPPASAPPDGAGAVALFEKVAATHGAPAANTLQVVPELCAPLESPHSGAPPVPPVPPPAVPAEPPVRRELPQATREAARTTATASAPSPEDPEERPTRALLTS